MKVKLISHCTDFSNPGYLKFKESLDIFKWDYQFLNERYDAYGSKMISAYNFAKKTDCSHLFICDAYDIYMLGTMQEAVDRLTNKFGSDCVVFNAEKACWPYTQWAQDYPIVESPWKYLNGGAAFVNTKRFIQLFEENPIQHHDNDQVNLARIYLDKRERYNMRLDTHCDVFQSIAFEHPDDFLLTDSNCPFVNLVTGSQPIIIHGNGKTNMNSIYKLL